LTDGNHSLLRVTGLEVAIGGRMLVQGLSLALRPGEFIALLGRNGCGKSLTLLTLAGLRAAAGGAIELGGIPLDAQSRRAIARQLALLTQDRDESLPLTALDSTLLGRHPHVPPWRSLSAADQALAADALARMGVSAQAGRLLDTLSGGEQRRAAMAALLAQQPRVYLLDEPTNHLDPHHQLLVLDQFQAECRRGAGVIASLHDAALAARYADRVLLLHGDGRWQLGATQALLTTAELSALYLTPLRELGSGNRRAFIPA
jgi:iron complex transport system ATP-binding protein